jgi:hypothetical protein
MALLYGHAGCLAGKTAVSDLDRYVERMAASLYYYKGYELRANPRFGQWFDWGYIRLSLRSTAQPLYIPGFLSYLVAVLRK